MTTIEFKNNIKRIMGMNNMDVLNKLNSMLEGAPKDTVYKVSEIQRAKIQKGIEQLDNGEYFTHTEVEQEISEWLKEQ